MPTSASVVRKKAKLRLKSWWANVKRAWLATQLTSYGGKYSVERMLALDEYIGRTSLWRVLLVIFITPLPMALVVISQESIPLQDPAEGWRVNYGFWIRSAVLEAAFAYITTTNVGVMIDGATLAPRQIVIFCTAVAVLNTIADITIAACWTFPVPFLTLTHSFVILLTVMIIFRVVVGERAFREIAAQQRQLMEYSSLNMLTVVMVVAYPAFQVLFEATLNTKWEQLTILLLPVLKLVLKFANVRLLAAKDDFLPQEITFSVNFFDALYLATCTA